MALVDTTTGAADTALHALHACVSTLTNTPAPVALDGVALLSTALINVEGSLHAADGAAVHIRKLRVRTEDAYRDAAAEDALLKLSDCSDRIAACKDTCAVALLTCLQGLTRSLASDAVSDAPGVLDAMQRCILHCCAIMLRLHALPAASSRADAAALAAARTLFALSKHEEMDALLRSCGCLTAAVAFMHGLQDVAKPPLPALTPTLLPLRDGGHALVLTSCVSTSCLMRSMETLTFLTGALKHATASEAAAVWLVSQGAVGPLTHLLVAAAADATSISARLDAMDVHGRRGGSATGSPAGGPLSPDEDDARLSVQSDLLSAEKALMQVCAQVTAIVRNLSVSKKCFAPLWAAHVVHALLALLQPARTCKYTEVVLNIARGLAKLSAQPEARSVVAAGAPMLALAMSSEHTRRISSATGAASMGGDRPVSAASTVLVDDSDSGSLPPAAAASRVQSAPSTSSGGDGDGLSWASAAVHALATPPRTVAASLLGVLQSKRGHADLVIRVMYALANTATTEEALRIGIAREAKGLSTLASVMKHYVTILLPHTHASLSTAADAVRSTSAADSSPSSMASASATASPMEAMDVVAKCARVLANLALTSSVGASLTSVKSMDAIGHVLLWACNLAEDDAASTLPVAVSTLLHDMLPCLISAVTNLAFYMDTGKLADAVHACALSLAAPPIVNPDATAPNQSHLVELPAPGITRMPPGTTFAAVAASAGAMGGDFSRACVLITVLMVRVVGAVALTGMRWSMAEVQRLTARVSSDGPASSAAAALEVNDAVLLECLRALGNLLRCSPLRTLLAPSVADLSTSAPPTHVSACICLIPAALCYCIASGGIDDVRYTATGVLLNLASDPAWKPALAHSDAFTPLLRALTRDDDVAAEQTQAVAVASASAGATALTLCGGSTAIASLTHVLHSAYYETEDTSLALVVVQCMVNYALGWEAPDTPPRFTSDECVSLMQSCSGIVEDAESEEDAEEDDAEAAGRDALYTAALRLYTILRAMVERDAVQQ